VSARQLLMAVVHSPHPITTAFEVTRDLRRPLIVASVLVWLWPTAVVGDVCMAQRNIILPSPAPSWYAS